MRGEAALLRWIRAQRWDICAMEERLRGSDMPELKDRLKLRARIDAIEKEIAKRVKDFVELHPAKASEESR